MVQSPLPPVSVTKCPWPRFVCVCECDFGWVDRTRKRAYINSIYSIFTDHIQPSVNGCKLTQLWFIWMRLYEKGENKHLSFIRTIYMIIPWFLVALWIWFVSVRNEGRRSVTLKEKWLSKWACELDIEYHHSHCSFSTKTTIYPIPCSYCAWT